MLPEMMGVWVFVVPREPHAPGGGGACLRNLVLGVPNLAPYGSSDVRSLAGSSLGPYHFRSKSVVLARDPEARK